MLLDTPLCEFGWKAPAFTLADPDGHRHSLDGLMGEHGLLVAFICNHCPYVKAVIDRLITDAAALAKTKGFLMINLDVRATQTRAIQSFEARGFSRYAVNEHYARVDDAYVTGYYFHKELK